MHDRARLAWGRGAAGGGGEETIAIFTDEALKAEKPIVLRPNSIHPSSTADSLYNLDGFPYFDRTGLTRTKKVGITITQYKALETTAHELVAAPGSGYSICLVGIMVFADRTSTESSSNDIFMGHHNSTTAGAYSAIIKDFMNNENADRTYNASLIAGKEISQGSIDNRALNIYTDGSGFNGDIALSVYVTYSIIES